MAMGGSKPTNGHQPLPEGLVGDLLEPAGYPLDPDAERGVAHVQTHLSHVFLLESRVYKLRKAVDLGFVTFASRARRNDDCLSEVRLNRRLAPDVYLGVAAVEPAAAGYRVGACIRDPSTLDDGLEHCVVMKRLEAGRDALSLLERGALGAAQVDDVAHVIARFHDTLPPVKTPLAGDIAGPAQANLRAIEAAGDAVVPRTEAAELRRETLDAVAATRDVLARRRDEGRVVEGHGDLHLQHVWFPGDAAPGAAPPIIDCLEFSADLRTIDVAAEVAFFAMDLAYRGAHALAERFLRSYVHETGDSDLYRVVDLFVSHRAAVRAKVAALAAADIEIDAAQRAHATTSAARHVALARRALAPRRPGDVMLVGGVIGSGKSTVARLLADSAHAVIVASDRIRKSMRGLAATDRLGTGLDEGAYAPDARAQVYREMLAHASAIVASGRSVVLDATWSEAAMRGLARAFAARHAARCVFVETVCDPAVLRARLEARAARGDDPSDAGPELLDESLHRFEPLEASGGWPGDERVRIDTEQAALEARVRELPDALGLRGVTVWD